MYNMYINSRLLLEDKIPYKIINIDFKIKINLAVYIPRLIKYHDRRLM